MNKIRHKNLYDISKFQNIPSGWTDCTIEEICHIGRGRVISQEEINSNPGVYPVYSSQTRNNGKMGSIETYDFDGDYITWTTDGENAGTIFNRKGKFNCTNVCGTLKSKNDEVDHQFLAYQLSSISKNYVSYIGNPKLMNGVMANVGLILPAKPTQKKISKILNTVDNLIDQTQNLIDKYTAVKQGMMADLFSRGIDFSGSPDTNKNYGQLRPSYEDAPELYQETELGCFPKQWKIQSLKERIEVSYGKSQVAVRDNDGSIPVYGTGGFIEYANSTMSETDSILIGRKGTLNNPYYIKAPFWVVDTAYFVSKFIDGDMTFLAKRLSTFDFVKLNESTGVPSLNRETLYREKLAFPPLYEQIEINRRIEAVDKYLDRYNAEKIKTINIKKGLMQDLLTGKVKA